MDFPVFVVLPGSGVGLRFGTPLPKQYTDIKNKSLFLYTVQAFHRYCLLSLHRILYRSCYTIYKVYKEIIRWVLNLAI